MASSGALESPSPHAATAGDAAPGPALSPRVRRAFQCRCGRPVFFGNTRCLACGTELGYDVALARVLPIEPAVAPNEGWRRCDEEGAATLYRRCANHGSALACSWLIEASEAQRFEQCRSCRLNRTLPDLSQPANQLLWSRVERDKQRLVASLIALGLPVASRTVEDPEHGLAFDLLHGGQSATPVMIGHADGVITLDIQEADDAHREAVRDSLREPYRTVLGHLRHESGHYYWDRLVANSRWLTPYRQLFGDERADYAAALQRHHHGQGPAVDWPQSFVSAYASAHPWEDWAETWAHHLHIIDTLDTALSFGLDASASGLLHDPFRRQTLRRGGVPAKASEDTEFLGWINAWVELTAVLNELSRSMGERDFYPFVLSAPAVAKLHLVHRIVNACASPAP